MVTSGAMRWVRLPIYDYARYCYTCIITICIDYRTPVLRGWVWGYFEEERGHNRPRLIFEYEQLVEGNVEGRCDVH